ncbi:MAG: hypothetical protein ACNA7J_08635 [Wenzhouxiangella sp.]
MRGRLRLVRHPFYRRQYRFPAGWSRFALVPIAGFFILAVGGLIWLVAWLAGHQ